MDEGRSFRQVSSSFSVRRFRSLLESGTEHTWEGRMYLRDVLFYCMANYNYKLSIASLM